ncbi:hypothetical protein PI124_g4516 [Phytophthora idaei]|nr:hypothetical protein PI125_g4105 [Phytophthora idaei]KAG3166372.1 hypothetical protein PI126_g4223 [Phytophthora idaei]KAG3250851.1 hypothetical protein PI124_g4516 [Phytophthora idaei]
MAFSGILKLKFGPFWLKTPILLVNVMPFGTRSATYILRVERPSVSGGRIELPIGRHGFPIDLLPRSAKDRRKLQFTTRYGAKGKKLRFLAPTAEVYGHWITVLREAFEGNVKVAKRTHNRTSRTIHETSVGVSSSNSDVQKTLVINDNDSMCEQRGSELDTSAATFDSCHQRGNNVTDVDSNSSNCDNVGVHEKIPPARSTTHTATEANPVPNVMNAVCDPDSDDYHSSRSSDELSSPLSSSVSSLPTDEDVRAGQQKVFCMAIDHDGTSIFSVYVPPQKARNGHTARRERLFNLSFEQWARWMAREIRDGDLPEVFRLTSETCKRLQLNEILSIVQPFFA